MLKPFPPRKSDDLRRQAALYRRLAKASSDPDRAQRLNALAEEQSAEAARLGDCGQAD